ncbi:DUF4192 domain-containing protein [Nocardioides sp. B-3]|nr:DUF4192 domain-containing protein [Nocardioides sp. B-3]UUZ58874.1 DUF4192 domain-containing protein [Nocardioides sp. B-3]
MSVRLGSVIVMTTPHHLSRQMKATCPEDLLAFVPIAIGFPPARSVVMLSVEGARQFHARVDLPADESDVDDVLEALLRPARRHGISKVVFVVYDDDTAVADEVALEPARGLHRRRHRGLRAAPRARRPLLRGAPGPRAGGLPGDPVPGRTPPVRRRGGVRRPGHPQLAGGTGGDGDTRPGRLRAGGRVRRGGGAAHAGRNASVHHSPGRLAHARPAGRAGRARRVPRPARPARRGVALADPGQRPALRRALERHREAHARGAGSRAGLGAGIHQLAGRRGSAGPGAPSIVPGPSIRSTRWRGWWRRC